MCREQVREDPRHGAAVLHHIRDAGRRAQIVLQHPEVTLGVADQVDARDMDAHTVGWHDARSRAVEMLARGHEPARDDAVAQNLLLAVDVVEVMLQRLDPLPDAALEPRPLSRRDHPRDEIQRKWALLAGQREGDALVDERAAERVGAGFQLRGVGRSKLGEDALVRAADVALGVEHLVEGLRIAAQAVVAVKNAFVPFRRPPVRARCSCGPGRQGSKAHPSHAAPHDRFRQARRPRFGRLGDALVP